MTELHGFEYLQRKRRRFSGNISRDQDSCSEFTDSTSKSEDHSRYNAARSQRKCDRKKNARVGGAKGPRDLFEALIDALKSNACGAHEKWKRHDGSGDDDRAPGEDDVNTEKIVQEMTKRAATSEKF